MSKDIRTFFAPCSSASVSRSHSDSEGSDTEPPAPKKQCQGLTSQAASSSQGSLSAKRRRYLKRWESDFHWLEYDEDLQGAFCKHCKKWGKSNAKNRGTWITKPFSNWKKATEKMKEHAESEGHLLACQTEAAATSALREGSVLQQMHRLEESERVKNRLAIKCFLRCTHFLARNHIAHTTNFGDLVDLVVSCGGEDLKQFVDKAGKNAQYTSKDAVVEFVEALGTWVDESLLARLQNTRHFSLLADECTNITTIEELSVACRWVENGRPVEHFIEIIPLKKADSKTIYETLVDCLKMKGVQISKLIGMGFDGAATFSGKRNGVQTLLKTNSPHSIFVHCHCHLLQLACVQAANSTPGIKHVYITLTTLWKFFHYSPKRAECLKEVQRVLNMPEMKVIKPSDTRWLAHERCVKAVKESYTAILITLNNIYEETHQPEALGIGKALGSKSTIFAVCLLNYVLPQVAKLSRTLQSEKLDLTVVSSLVEATLYSLDDALSPAANWVLELHDMKESLEEVTGVDITTSDIQTFQNNVGNPFVSTLKGNISSRFCSQDIVSALSIFDPKKTPNSDSSEYQQYGECSVKVLLDHYGGRKTAVTLEGEEYEVMGLVSSEITAEWKTLKHYLTKKPQEDMASQLHELVTNETLISMFPNLNTLATICLTLPIGTASVERSFSQMKMIKTRLRNRLGEKSLSHLMKIAIEAPDKLSDSDLENVVDIWYRKGRRLIV